MTRVALVAQHDGIETHSDGPPLLAALADRDIDAEIVPWGGARDWSAYDGVVIRNPWDYLDRRAEFLTWARSVESCTRLANPAAMLEWNSDKRYLQALARAGVPTVDTLWVEADDPIPAWSWDDVVVKPAVSAGSRNAARWSGGDREAIVAHVGAITAAGGTAMIQPYLADVDRIGESGTYVFGGRVSHAITKSAVLQPGTGPYDDFTLVTVQTAVAAEVTSESTEFAQHVMARVPAGLGEPLYARVDALRHGDGRLVLLELELFEPFFFLETAPDAAHRFASAVETWLQT